MEIQFLVFWLVVYSFLLYLRHKPNSIVAKAALTWIGPKPSPGQSRSTFQLRWAAYSFGWLCQFAVALSALWWLVSTHREFDSQWWFQVLWFALAIGGGVALLATLGFLAKSAISHYLGPNPFWEGNIDGRR